MGNFQRAVYSIIALTGDLDVAGGLAMGPGLPFDYSASTAAFRLEDMYARRACRISATTRMTSRCGRTVSR